MKRVARSWAIDFLIIFLLTGALIKPLFKVKYLDKWASIESTFISDARFLAEHWPHPNWQPLWYCGTRFDYVYPPMLRYGTAGLTKLFPILPVRAYHIYTAFFYCLGIAGVYLFVRICSGSRGAAWLAAIAATLVSPSFLFMKDARADAWYWVPQRLGVLVRYGEGPHMTALALLPIALAFAYRAMQKRRPIDLALAAVGCAMVVSNNFYGATSLAIIFPILAWSLYITQLDMKIWWRALAIILLAYGLTASWLVPSYLRITLANMQFVSEKGNAWSIWVGLAVAIAFILLTDKYARGKTAHAYTVLVIGIVVFFTMNVLGQYYFNFRIIGEPSRMVPELDLVLIIGAVEILRRLWYSKPQWRTVARTAAAVVVVVSLATSKGFVRRAWRMYPTDPNVKERVEYRMQDWIAQNMPQARTLAAGSVRFWYDAWNNLPELGGGSDQGLSNTISIPAQWQILMGDNAELSVLWLQVLGTDAIIVSDEKSQDTYHDYAAPKKFVGVLPVLLDDKQGNVIYRVPRRYPGLARVVNTRELDSLGPILQDGDLNGLRAHAALVERGPDVPAQSWWESTDVLRVKAKLSEGQSLVVQESYDVALRAYSGGRPLPVRPDSLGFIRIDAPPRDYDIRLVYELPWENIAGRILSVIAFGVLATLLIRGVRRRPEALA
jgi:hypothetical protein